MKEQDQLSILDHINHKKAKLAMYHQTYERIRELDAEVGLKPETMRNITTVISSKIAQCEISIRDHEKLLS